MAAYDVFGELFDLDNKIPETLNIADSDPLTVNFDALGYETAYYAVNMGSALIIYLLMPFGISIVLLVRHMARGRNSKLHNRANKYVKEFFFNSLIVSVEEMYIIVLICIFVNYVKIMEEGFILDINSIALILNSIIVFLYPVLIIALCFVEKETLLDDNVMDRIGILYEDLDLENKGKVVFIHLIASVARRLIFGVTLVFGTGYPLF